MTATGCKRTPRVVGIFGLAAFAILLGSIPAAAQNAYDKGTPAESKGGLSGISTYAQDKVETINLANGNLSMQFPLATIGGRGGAAYTVALSYNSKLWSAEHSVTNDFDPLGNPHVVHHYSATYNDGTSTRPNEIMLGSGWSISKGPAIRARRVVSDVVISPQHPGTHLFILTRVWLVLPDGSEIGLRDDATDGAPAATPLDGQGPHHLDQDRDRGRVWHSVDGSAITYITDAANGVVSGLLNGWVFLPDGSRMRMLGSDGSSNRCRKIIDRNGNVLSINYDVPVAGAVTYTDQTGRQVIVQGGVQGAAITIKGYNGAADRTINIEAGQLAPANNSQPAPNLRADYDYLSTGQYPRPFLSGNFGRSFFGDVEHIYTLPCTELFSLSEPMVSVNDLTGVTRVNLLDGRSFRFRYNPWGEVAEILYPGGGVSQIDYQALGSFRYEGGPIRPQLNRAVTQRRVLAGGATVEATWSYNRGAVTVHQGAPAGPEILKEEHSFVALDADFQYLSDVDADGNFYFDGVGYEAGGNAKESAVVRWVNGTQTQVETREWQPRQPIVWPNDQGQSVNQYVKKHGQEQPPNNERVTFEKITLENGRIKRVDYAYDQFNNVLSVIETGFGVGSAGPPLRQTTRTYLSNQNGFCYTGLNGLDGGCGGSVAVPDEIIHRRRLMLNETIKDGGGNVEAYTEIEYDNYAADGNHAPVQYNAGMTQYEDNWFTAFAVDHQPRGNVTSVKHLIGGQVTGGVYTTDYSQYDNAGNVVKAIDPLGRAATVSYADNFGDGSNPSFGLGGTNGPAFAFPTTVTNALGQTARTQYDYSRGVATGIKDPNNVITRTEHNDPFDRITRITAGYGLSGSNTSITDFTYPTAFSNTTTVSKQL